MTARERDTVALENIIAGQQMRQERIKGAGNPPLSEGWAAFLAECDHVVFVTESPVDDLTAIRGRAVIASFGEIDAERLLRNYQASVDSQKTVAPRGV